jgi:hypothetical protein
MSSAAERLDIYEDRPVYWVAGGGDGRDLTGYFLKHGVLMVGPGWRGDWFAPDGGPAAYGKEARFIRPIAEAKAGDIVLLTHGFSIVAVGTIDAGYEYWQGAGRQEGWDLHHCRRVRWAPLGELTSLGQPPVYPVRSRAGAVHSRDVTEWARTAAATADQLGLFEGPLPALPKDEQPLRPDDYPPILRPAIERVQSMWRVIGTARSWAWPSEAEACALLVVPLLLDFGLRPENLTLEWNRTDVAVFRGSTPRWEDCLLVVEVKRPGSGLASARNQGAAYVWPHRRLGIPILTTNGFAWTLYPDLSEERSVSAFLPEPTTSALPFFEALASCLRDGPGPSEINAGGNRHE